MQTSVFPFAGKITKRRALVASATATRNGFLRHGVDYGTADHRLHSHCGFDRNISYVVQQQLLQNQASASEPPTYNFGFNIPARKPADWLSDSHTRPANSHLAAYGCYRVVGPARISKRGGTLVAHLYRGSRVELLDRDGNATPYGLKESPREPADLFTASMSMSSICSEDGAPGNSASTRARDESYGDDNTFCVAECVLVAAHVELCGSACSVDWPAVHHHNGHTYVSVRSLPPWAVIELDADADLRHPINITPVDT